MFVGTLFVSGFRVLRDRARCAIFAVKRFTRFLSLPVSRQMHFNDLFEATRRAKEDELKRAGERIGRLRYCASELKTMFGIDTDLEPIDVPTWHVDEIPDCAVTVTDREVSEKVSRQREARESTRVETIREDGNKAATEDDFYAAALERMMDGVLELR